jgi:threonine synthase
MDIQVSSNFERYLWDLLGRDSPRLAALMDQFRTSGTFTLDADLMSTARQDFMAYRCDDDETLRIIDRMYTDYGQVVDPHTAVGIKAMLKARAEEKVDPIHPLCGFGLRPPSQISCRNQACVRDNPPFTAPTCRPNDPSRTFERSSQ